MAEKLSELGVQGTIVEYRRLDVEPSAVKGFMDEMRRSPPDVILSMGVSDRRRWRRSQRADQGRELQLPAGPKRLPV